MRKVFLVLMLLGLTTPLMAQDPIELSEVLIGGTNYKYLNAVNYVEAPMPVRFLEQQAAEFKAEGHDLYVDEFGSYSVSFFIPDGKVVGFYDADDMLVRTIERYKNVQLPDDVQYALITRFPNWEVTKDVYHVTYHQTKGVNKYFVLKLTNGNKTIRVKIDDEGTFM